MPMSFYHNSTPIFNSQWYLNSLLNYFTNKSFIFTRFTLIFCCESFPSTIWAFCWLINVFFLTIFAMLFYNVLLRIEVTFMAIYLSLEFYFNSFANVILFYIYVLSDVQFFYSKFIFYVRVLILWLLIISIITFSFIFFTLISKLFGKWLILKVKCSFFKYLLKVGFKFHIFFVQKSIS